MPVSQATLLSETPESVADVTHERHKTSALDGGCDGMLRRRGATRLATADDFALTAREFLEQFDVLVIDVHRTHTLAVRAKGIALLAVNLSLGTFTIDTIFLECRRFGHVSTNFFVRRRQKDWRRLVKRIYLRRRHAPRCRTSDDGCSPQGGVVDQRKRRFSDEALVKPHVLL